MRFNDDHASFRNSVRRVVDAEINPFVDEWEAAGTFPAHDLFPKLASIGLLGLEYEPEYGGEGADHSFTMIACEELGRVEAAGVSMAINVQSNMATPSLARYGTAEQKRQFLAPAIAGTAVAAIGVTEPDSGSDVSALRTRAVRDGNDWVITGRKLYITNGTQADWVCLLARTSNEGSYRGMSQIIVATGSPGFSVSRKLDKLGTPGHGFQQQMEQFIIERLSAAYSIVGQCDMALARTREYLHQRQVFGQTLASKQYVAFRVTELAAQVDLLRSHNTLTCETLMAGEDVTRMAAIAKLTAGRLVREVADLCLQFHGGVGYMEETWTSRFFRDSRLASIGAGADEVMLQVLARLDGLPAS
jgi:citronellyl-CoA dehydrogenase